MSTTTPYYPTLADALDASNVNVAELPANAVGVQQHTSTGTTNANLRQRKASVWMSQPYRNGSTVCREANLHELIPDLPQPARVFCKNGNAWTDVTPPPTTNINHPANRETISRPQQPSSSSSQKSTPMSRATQRATNEIARQARNCTKRTIYNQNCSIDLPTVVSRALGL